jgi:hypothetical protein
MLRTWGIDMQKWVKIFIVLMTSSVSSQASAHPSQVTRVTEGLISAGIVIELADKCDSVDIRMIKGLSFLNGLKGHLKDLGYSNAEIDAYIDDAAEKDRLEAIARTRLRGLGAVPGDPESHCAVAHDQMSRGTLIGGLLR